ncbi:MAG: hypothetical protein CAF41_006065 [Nitrospira sp. CG24A]|nr:MAG: hypothetical protein CAF41_006065 [Nitrospira sp. CG24A]
MSLPLRSDKHEDESLRWNTTGGAMMRILDVPRVIFLMAVYVMVIPVIVIVAALLHDTAYDDLHDEW